MPRETALRRVVLLPAAAPAARGDAAPIRRYRLARIAPEAPATGDRFAHLRRAHD